jgi:glucokinase
VTSAGGLVAGIDLGGTNLRVGLVTEDGTVVGRTEQRTPASHSPGDVIEAIVHCLGEVTEERGTEMQAVAGLGIGVPGAPDRDTGIIRISPNFGWRDVPFRDLMRSRLPEQTVVMDNDVRVVTYGEWQFGAGQGASDLMCVTVGTGVGSGLILRREPYSGSGGAAGEIGHIQLDPRGPKCGCGNNGCLEVYASAKAVAREAERRGFGVAGEVAPTAAMVADAATGGDLVAAEILAGAAAALAHGIAAAVNLLNLERVVIGGGLARSGASFWEPFERALARQVMAPHLAHVTVAPTALGDDAGILGGAWMVRRVLGAAA